MREMSQSSLRALDARRLRGHGGILRAAAYEGRPGVSSAGQGRSTGRRNRVSRTIRGVRGREPVSRQSPQALGAPPAPADGDRRAALADWLLNPTNPFFARSIVNRAWFHLFGRGIVHPVDDFRASNPPVHPDVLDYLARDFATHQFDLRRLLRQMLTSRAYQLSETGGGAKSTDDKYFSHAQPRLLSAEQLLDAVCDVTGVLERFPGFPVGTRAVQLPDGEIQNSFLKAFGQPARELPCECERDSEANLGQALQLVGGAPLHDKLREPKNRHRRFAREVRSRKRDPRRVIPGGVRPVASSIGSPSGSRLSR